MAFQIQIQTTVLIPRRATDPVHTHNSKTHREGSCFWQPNRHKYTHVHILVSHHTIIQTFISTAHIQALYFVVIYSLKYRVLIMSCCFFFTFCRICLCLFTCCVYILLCFANKSKKKKRDKKALETYIFYLCIPPWLLCTVIIYSLSSWMFLALPLELFAVINPAQHIRTFVTHSLTPLSWITSAGPHMSLSLSFFFFFFLTSYQNRAYCITVPGQM